MNDVGGFYQHPQALVESDAIGAGTRIWAFAHVLGGAIVGKDCNLCDHTFIEGGAVVGDRVTLKCGVQLWAGVILHDDVFVGPNATFTNDRFPRSRAWLDEHPRTIVEAGASVGANATILPGVRIGVGAMVGAGSVVTHDVPPHAVVAGNPARILRYTRSPAMARESVGPAGQAARDVGVGKAKLVPGRAVRDMRGKLSAREVGDGSLPFLPRRCFAVYEVPSEEIRGEHAHKKLHQLLCCLRGSVCVSLDDGERRAELTLDSADVALYIPPLVWGVQHKYSADALLLVFASDDYDTDDYIRDYDEFLALTRGRRGVHDEK